MIYWSDFGYLTRDGKSMMKYLNNDYLSGYHLSLQFKRRVRQREGVFLPHYRTFNFNWIVFTWNDYSDFGYLTRDGKSMMKYLNNDYLSGYHLSLQFKRRVRQREGVFLPHYRTFNFNWIVFTWNDYSNVTNMDLFTICVLKTEYL